MSLRVLNSTLHLRELQTRMPFRFGIANVTRLLHAILRIEFEIDGRRQIGLAAENLVPKWFTKDPNTTPQQDQQQMVGVIRTAMQLAGELGPVESVYQLWRQLQAGMEQPSRAPASPDPPLLLGLGVSLVERAAIDALCRARRVAFWQAMRAGMLGIELGQIYPQDLIGARPAELLPPRPLSRVLVRHTVGLSDPLSDSDISPADRLDDGLPHSLQSCIDAYGLRSFKIKLWGDVQRDSSRLADIAALLDANCPDYAYSLDGNENFHQVEPLIELWRRLSEQPRLKRFLSRLMFLEQPLHREIALSEPTRRQLLIWSDRPAMIIDESGASTQDVVDALAGGYVGVSHKNCKGVIKGIAAACLIESRRRRGQARLILSAEDLSNTGPIALAQDLAVVAALGVGHVERNGHHYFRGLHAWPKELQQAVLAEHADLFRAVSAQDASVSFVAPAIQAGQMWLDSLNSAAFGVGAASWQRVLAELNGST
ncbi:hypothetical protein [Fontivita pretiosa]|uniref:hypothetical protein n=1 Tax=Fontivita pretiosa TaxID=2989684 RepID=UPI003D170F10